MDKHCPRCDQDKNAEKDFFRDARRKDGLYAICKDCHRAVDKASASKGRNRRRCWIGKRAVYGPGPREAWGRFRATTPNHRSCKRLWALGYRLDVNGTSIVNPRGQVLKGMHLPGLHGVVSIWSFAAFCQYGAMLFQPGTVVRSRTGSLLDLAGLYLDSRANLNRDSHAKIIRVSSPKTWEPQVLLSYDPREDVDRAVRENMDLLQFVPRCHWEVFWLAMREAASKFDPSKGVPLRAWMRWIARRRIQTKMRAEGVRYRDDAPGYRMIGRGDKARALRFSGMDLNGCVVCTTGDSR